ncbi:MAG: ComF family protein [Parcubacteria group bacterium]|nr:ComF family protein [Parcubacteria group bacterium]
MSCVEELPRVAHDETGFVSVFQYKDETIRRLLWTLKYKGGKDIAAVCAKMLYEELCAELEELVLFQEFEKPLVIPIPLSQKRWRERGFNQAELIAKELVTHGEGFKLCVEVLEKHKETAPQATIKNREARLRNVLGCFSLSHPEQIAGRNIILIDDIYTTGGTMLEARKVLEAAGARKILCCTVAH